MYCHDCENYFGEASCRVKGLTGYLRKADELPCFTPKQPKNENNMSKKTNTIEGITARTCKVCGCTYPVTMFDPDSRSKDGLSHICRDCADKRAIERGKKIKAALKEKKEAAKKVEFIEPLKAAAEEEIKKDFFKDDAAKPQPDYEGARIGEMPEDYARLVHLLKKAGFTGTITKTWGDPLPYELTITIR